MRDRFLTSAFPPARADRLEVPATVSSLPLDADLDQLAIAASAGDVDALARVYDELVDPIHRYVALRVRRREDAEDITQLVFERLVTALPRYRHHGKPFRAWVFRIAHNAVVDHHRRYRQTEPLGGIAEPVDAVMVEALSLRGEELRELGSAIGQLTPDQQEAIALRYGAGLSADEAARVMGRQPGTIRGLTFRAIASLRRIMTVEGAG